MQTHSSFTPRIWLIDDIEHWHVVTQSTLTHLGAHRFQGFFQASSALMALDHCRPTQFPHFIFMDYFINEDRGDIITRQIRASFPNLDCSIIGYSTAASGSRAIVQAGGNEIVPKHSNEEGLNPSLLEWTNRFKTGTR